MHDFLNLNQVQKEWHGSLKSYLIGFGLSLFLTMASFALALFEFFSFHTLVYLLIASALIQAMVQLVFFLHLGREPKPRWESLIFVFTFLILLTVVIGTLWIMHDLHMRTMQGM